MTEFDADRPGSRARLRPAEDIVAFEREADMLIPLVTQPHRFAGRNARTRLTPFYEVQTLRGVVDLLLVELDHSVLSYREKWQLDPVVNLPEVAVLRTFSQELSTGGQAVLTSRALSDTAVVGTSHLRRRVLPTLESAGWIAKEGRDSWRLVHDFHNPVRRIIAVEAKRSDWRHALTQAASHREFADATYVALDAAKLPRVDSWRKAFEFNEVGLITITADSSTRASLPEAHVSELVKAPRRRPRGLARVTVAERVAMLSASGCNSGVVNHVFGRAISTSWGDDPRLIAAGT
ncbi:hypothetical protein [Amycolatopsis methanolica]|uniref:hypothetical protein n=1 Tax=Amycolatopsis methanolica TaxID=1814 RepID=UPI003440BEC9